MVDSQPIKWPPPLAQRERPLLTIKVDRKRLYQAATHPPAQIVVRYAFDQHSQCAGIAMARNVPDRSRYCAVEVLAKADIGRIPAREVLARTVFALAHSDHRPTDGKQRFHLRALGKSALKLIDQLVAAGHDFIFNGENLLPLTALLSLQLLKLLLD